MNDFELIEKTKNEWEAASDALLQVILLLDRDGRIIRTNRVIESWGIGPVKDAPGKKLHELIHPRCMLTDCLLKELWDQVRVRLTKGESSTVSYHDSILNRYLDVELRPISGSNHVAKEAWESFSIVIFTDVTVKREAQSALIKSEEKFSKAFHHNPAAMSISRMDDGNFVEVNQTFEELFGYKKQEIVGKTSLEISLWANPDDREKVIAQVRRNGSARNLELSFFTKKGAKLECRYSGEVIEIGNDCLLLSTVIDLTQNKLAQAALEIEKSFSDAVLDSVPGLLYLFDESGYMIRCNRKTEELTGYSIEELKTKPILDWLPDIGDNRKIIFEAIQKAFRQGYAETEAILMSRDGVPLLMFLTGVRMETMGKAYLVGVGTDISQRRLAEDALRYNRNMLANIIDTVPLSVYWKDKGCLFQGCNKVFAQLIGVDTPDVVSGISDFDLPCTLEEAERYRADDLDVLKHGKTKRHHGVSLPTADGSRIMTDVTKVPLIDGNGNICGLLGVIEDITERKDAENQIRRMSAELKSVIQVLPDQFWRLDRDGNILSLNFDQTALPGKFISIISGRNILDLLPLPVNEQVCQALKQVQATKSLVKLKYEIEIEGEIQIFEARFLSLLEDQIFVLNRNITEQERMESIAQSVDMMNNFGYIFSGIRHEIGNPINSIKMTVSVLKNQIDRYSRDMIMEYIERILSEVFKVEYLLKSLKTFNMYERQNPKLMGIVAFMEDFLGLIRSDFERRGIDVECEIDPNIDKAFFDPRALQQLLLNLVNNAVDAVQDESKGQITIRVKRRKDRMEITVVDNGCGMNLVQRDNLFRLFFTSKSNGTGLGLVIVKKLLSQMDGTIDVESEKGKGTTVVVTLPLKESELHEEQSL